MISTWPRPPQPRPIEKVSPSLGESLLSCALRTAFRLDASFGALDRGGLSSALGLASHALTEEVARGRFADVEAEGIYAALEQRFDALIEVERIALQKHWPSAVPPEPERWPGYRPTRRRLVRRLSERSPGRREATAAPLAAISIEDQIEAPDLPLLGRPDRIEQDEDGTHLIDLKSGWSEMTELRPAHRRQLLIYAYIWHAIHDEWPTSAVIQRLDGSRLALNIDPEEARALVEDLLARMEEFNGAVGKDAWARAAPSPEACEHCAYRAACPPFFEALSPEWGCFRRSLLGVVIGKEEIGDSCAIEVALEAGNLPSEVGRARVLSVPPGLNLAVEESIAVVDALPTRSPHEVRLGWDSCIYSWTRAAVIV